MTLTYKYADGIAPFVLRDGAAWWTNGDGMTPIGCLWFAKCPNAAVTSVAHPILGDVPTCQTCADRMADGG